MLLPPPEMAKKEKEEKEVIPEYIAKHKKLYHHATKLADTAAHTHSEAYTSAVNKHLMEDGEVNFEKLDNDKVQEQFVKTMSDLYTSRAKQHFKVAKDLDDVEKDILMQAYAGVTSHQLKGLLNQYGKRFTHREFENIKGQLQQQIQKRLYASAAGHLEEGHVPDIIKHVGLEGKVNTAQITVDEARELLEAFQNEGAIADSVLRQHVAQYKIKKKAL